jgi:hypothetical protein
MANWRINFDDAIKPNEIEIIRRIKTLISALSKFFKNVRRGKESK